MIHSIIFCDPKIVVQPEGRTHSVMKKFNKRMVACSSSNRTLEAEFIPCPVLSAHKTYRGGALNSSAQTPIETRHHHTMTSKVNNSFSMKSLPQATENKSFSKLTSAVGQPLRKLFNTNSSDRSTKSESMAATEQEEFRVRFSEKMYVRNTLAWKDFTTEEIQACWYTDEENQRIHRHCSKEIRKMDEGSELKDETYSSRGLEGHTTIGAAAKKRIRLLAINAVLDEQMIQWEEGIFDEDAIAEIYYRASSSCQVSASIVGLRDHRETEAYVGSCSRRRRRSGATASRRAAFR